MMHCINTDIGFNVTVRALILPFLYLLMIQCISGFTMSIVLIGLLVLALVLVVVLARTLLDIGSLVLVMVLVVVSVLLMQQVY